MNFKIKSQINNYYLFANSLDNNIKKKIKKFKNFNIIYDRTIITNLEEIIDLNKYCKKNKIKLFLIDNYNLAIKLKCSGILINSNNNKNYKHYKPSFEYIGLVHNQRELFFKRFQNFHQIMLSPLFYNFKYSKSRILETLKFNIITKNWKTPLIALGGISLSNFKKLKITRVTGIGFKKFIEQV